MNRKHYITIVSVLIALFQAAILIVLQLTKPVPGTAGNTILYITFGFAILALLVATYYVLMRKQDVSEALIVLGATFVFQFFPWIIYPFLLKSDPKYLLITIITFVAVIGYVGLFLGSDVLSSKTEKVQEQFKPEEIPVKNEKEYFDEDGNFKGTSK